MKAVLIIFDLTGISLSFVLAFFVRFKVLGIPHTKSFNLGPAHLWMLTGVGFAAITLFGLHRLYEEKVYARRLNQLSKIGKALLILFGLLFVGAFFLRSEAFFERRSLPLLSFIFSLLFVTGLRLGAFHLIYRWMLERGIGVSRVIIVGQKEKVAQLAQKISDFDKTRYRLVGTVAEPARLPDIVREKRIDEVFLTSFSPKQTMGIASKCRELSVRVNVLSDMFDVLAGRADVELIDGLPLVSLNGSSKPSFPTMVKRVSDFTIALFSVLLLSPLFALISIGTKLTSKGPVLFRQRRLGERKREFTFYKFRSMFNNADSGTHRKWVKKFISNPGGNPAGAQKMTRDHRVTKFGYFLRRSSLDELPQLINVLRGEMSLVGPRPPIPYEADLYKGWQRKRLGVKPGITGLWQVSGRSSVSFNEMVLLDIYYAENWSLGLDLEILLKTIPMVISRKGAY